jgi:hypothetical protein
LILSSTMRKWAKLTGYRPAAEPLAEGGGWQSGC